MKYWICTIKNYLNRVFGMICRFGEEEAHLFNDNGVGRILLARIR